MRVLALSLGLGLVPGLVAAPAAAHEFWIEPLDYEVGAQAMLRADLVNGQRFEGTRYAYLPQRFERFEILAGTTRADAHARLGARPALDMAPLSEGLHVAAYRSTVSVVRYEAFADFLSFAEHKDFGPDIADRHRAAGFPTDAFAESYIRFAKALIAVGDGAGQDLRTGLETEIVAGANPYTDDLSQGLPVRVFLGSEVRADAQVELFEKAPDGTVTVSYHRTDAEGRARLPVRPGHAYLVDAVALRRPPPDRAAERDVVWETLWASLVFAVPDD